MKRTDNLDLAQALWDECVFATLSLSEADGTPYGVPISPARHGNALYFHCALRGRKTTALRSNPRVSISCVGKAQVMPGQFNISYQSVVASGTATEVTQREEKITALRLISEKLCPEDMGGFQAELDKALDHTGIWKITLDQVTTKG